ncbi:MAG: stage II sporulation protein D [Clostridia bacterium]|nr:stage II sporulation protein D [Clostridia bacterium]
MKYRINYKRLLVLTLLVCIFVLVLRGCAASCRTGEVTLPEDSEEEYLLRLYDEEQDRVLTLTLNEYLIGVVAAEMPASFEAEALAAQAVAARTFTAAHMQAFSGTPCGREGCDTCSDSGCCQAWDDDAALRKKWGTSYAANREKVAAAVYATSGEVLLYDGELIEALYHSTSGGRTEDSENVFSAALPYLRAVDSPGEEDAPRYERTVKFSEKSFLKKLNAAFPKADLKDAEEVRVLSRYESGRVERAQVGKVTATGRELRKALSLDSANFTLKYKGDTVLVTTRGFGHGVGMSQLGANAMAQAGADYRGILTHYYTGVTVASLSTVE